MFIQSFSFSSDENYALKTQFYNREEILPDLSVLDNQNAIDRIRKMQDSFLHCGQVHAKHFDLQDSDT